MTAPALTGVAVGDRMTELSRRVGQEQINAYAGASGDANPIHVDADFATSVGLPGAIAHGLLDMGILAEAVARWAGGAEHIAALACRFSKPLVAGDTITCTGWVTEVDEERGVAVLEVEATSNRGERVLTNGRAEVRLHPERA